MFPGLSLCRIQHRISSQMSVSTTCTRDSADLTSQCKLKQKAIKTLVLHVISSRFVLFLVQLIFNSFDFSTDAFKGIEEPDDSVFRLLRGFVRWDSIQFLHIARHGYVYEHSLAFFPLFPTLLRTGADVISIISSGVFSPSSNVILSGFFLNHVCFLISSLLIYSISSTITSSKKIASISVLLFSINPASIFFSSLYTESLYCCLTLLGIYVLISSSSFYIRLPLVTILFSAALLTRSNGLLNIGYVLFYEGLRSIRGQRNDRIVKQILNIGWYLARVSVVIIFVILSLRVHSVRQTNQYCTESKIALPESVAAFGIKENLTIIGTAVPWCSQFSIIYPPFFSSIQDRYWDVSLFGYWKIQKLPCFLMAAPVIIFTIYCTIRVLNRLLRNGVNWFIDSYGDSLPYALHSIALLIPALLIYNVEVYTRIIFSSSPFLYIELARILDENTPNIRVEHLAKPTIFPFVSYLLYRRDICCVISAYFFLFYFMGTVMHTSFLPFT
ncbi:hypothetical protein PFISCL1PPCAC_19750 [Pristionchus fissidentatus]|uniref:GPI mannosyltransferase 2 n=1 Tax=Pristionchus fissidentatus TaxID=1538716 RepID=A0AAV5WDM5_9BILA|nr:hypothetical protein PFISCL1PPCAC_19750 [Pristionchus fissidentatus]